MEQTGLILTTAKKKKPGRLLLLSLCLVYPTGYRASPSSAAACSEQAPVRVLAPPTYFVGSRMLAHAIK